MSSFHSLPVNPVTFFSSHSTRLSLPVHVRQTHSKQRLSLILKPRIRLKLKSFTRHFFQHFQLAIFLIIISSIGPGAQQIVAPDWPASVVTSTKETTAPTNHSLAEELWNQSSSLIIVDAALANQHESNPTSITKIIENNSLTPEMVANETNQLLLTRIRFFESLLEQIDEISNRQKCEQTGQPLSSISTATKVNPILPPGYTIAKHITPQRISLPAEANRLLQPQLQNYLTVILNRLKLVAALLSEYQANREQLEVLLTTAVRRLRDTHVLQVRAALVDDVSTSDSVEFSTLSNSENSILHTSLLILHSQTQNLAVEQRNVSFDLKVPWLRFGHERGLYSQLLSQGRVQVSSKEWPVETNIADWPSSWTDIQFDCDTNRWLVSVGTILLHREIHTKENVARLKLTGLLSLDIELHSLDIDQCATFLLPQHLWQPSEKLLQNRTLLLKENRTSNYVPVDLPKNVLIESSKGILANFEITVPPSLALDPSTIPNDNVVENSVGYRQQQSSVFLDVLSRQVRVSSADIAIGRLILSFPETHKCHRPSSKCEFIVGHGLRKGGYNCKCRDGFFTTLGEFRGPEVEKKWKEQQNRFKQQTYEKMSVCQRCSPGCDTCADGSPCLSSYNWSFRTSLLIISILCILVIIVLTYCIYKHRKIKVFKVASPVFLSLTLLGCAIMYAEMIAIFPELSTGSCIMTKVTRHLGFCITYSALLLKTWRVSLTYRVKSAHKLRVTDQQLLHWLFPILLVMGIFLGAWTISAAPRAIYIHDWNGLKFKICEYNWWDHSLAIGELLFLLWGIKVCYNVRNAESFFNEAKYITWAIYNIAIVNIVMITIHLAILPNAGPDVKYFLGFVRTQLSTTTTILLIFGAKFYRLLKGEGDNWDPRVRTRGINASFSINGVGVTSDELTDLFQENEELKEQIHKLAGQVERMRLLQMQVNNRHLKSKHSCGSAVSVGQLATVPPTTGSQMISSTGLTGSSSNLAASRHHLNHIKHLNPASSPIDGVGIGLVTGIVGGLVPPSATLNMTGVSIQRISPAAELQSERV